MKKAILLSLVMSLAGASVALAHGGNGMRFEKLDANGDGKVTQEEMLAKHTARFEDADTNKDGKLSEQERQKAHEKMRAEHFQARDANHDGKLTQAELERMPPQLFRKLDQNNDGALSPDELERGKEMHEHGKGRGEHAWHKDGEVTRDEMKAHVTHMFEKLDGNHDGALTKDELAAAHGRHRGEREHGHGHGHGNHQ